MPNHSSIFNFSVFQALSGLRKSFCLSLALVLAFAAALHPLGVFLNVRDPQSRIANSIRYLKSQEAAKPRVLFFGSSRTMSCVDAETFARENGMPPGTVLNVARPGMGPWETLVVLRNTPSILDSVETVIVEVVPAPFNDNAIHPITHKEERHPAEFDTWATYRERKGLSDPALRYTLLAKYVFSLTQRRNLVRWLGIGKAILTREPWAGRMPPPPFHADPVKTAILARDPSFQATTISRCHLRNYHFCQQRAMVVRELLAFLRRRGVDVAVLHPPVRKEYYDHVASNAPLSTEFGKYRSVMRDLAEECQTICWETVEDCGLDDSVLVDYGHFSRDGAIAFTKRVSDEMRTGKTSQKVCEKLK